MSDSPHKAIVVIFNGTYFEQIIGESHIRLPGETTEIHWISGEIINPGMVVTEEDRQDQAYYTAMAQLAERQNTEIPVEHQAREYYHRCHPELRKNMKVSYGDDVQNSDIY